MPLYGEFDRYYAEKQHHQKVRLRDPDETIQSKLPVADGELILTQTRLYLAVGGREGDVPNVRLERVRPKTYPEDDYLEIAPRMGAFLARGQTGVQFLQMVDYWRKPVVERVEVATRSSREGIRRRYDSILEIAGEQRERGDRRKAKDTLRNLHGAEPGRSEAAARLGEMYLEERNFRAALVWLVRAGVYDGRFEQAVSGVHAPRLPSREQPPPEWWIDRHLTPLLELPEGEGPDDGQRRRIREARARIDRFRRASGRISVAGGLAFVAALAGWVVLLFLSPWLTLGVSAAVAVALGTAATLSARRRRRPKR